MRKLFLLLMVALVALSAVVPVLAEDPPPVPTNATVTVNGGTITPGPLSILFPAVAIQGNQIVTVEKLFNLVDEFWTINDARGTGAGWIMYVAAEDFHRVKDANGVDLVNDPHTIAVANFKMELPQASVEAGPAVTSSVPQSAMINGLVSLDPVAQKVLEADDETDEGMGMYHYAPRFTLSVLPSTWAGQYLSVLTVTVGPDLP